MIAPAIAPSPSPWILSRRDDLIWFQGSVLTGFALLALFALLPGLDDASYRATHPAVIVLLVWGVVFDGTHIFGTYARTWLAPDAASRAGMPGPWSLLLLLFGPAVALVDSMLPQAPSMLGHAGMLFRSWLSLAYLWAYWHLVRQHYGFLVLYQRRAPDLSPRTAQVEVALLWVGSLHPYLRYSLGDAIRHSGLPVLVPESLSYPLRVALDVSTALIVVAAVTWIAVRLRGRLGPRHLLLALVIVFQEAVFAVLDNLLLIAAAVTIFHNLQYHRIVWQFERGHGRRPVGGLLRYLALGLLLGVVWYVPRTLGVVFVQTDLARNVLLGLGWGFAFHHYYADGRIWRVRRSREVAGALDRGAVAA